MNARNTPEVEELNHDCFRLVLVWRSLEWLGETFKMESRMDLAFHLTQLRAVENDIIMRLCRLDEPASEAASFRRARKSLQGRCAEADLRTIDKAVDGYRKAINPVKNARRNREIAHRGSSIEEFDPYATRWRSREIDGTVTDHATELPRLVQMAVATTDLIAGGPINLKFRPGSVESAVDLRQPLERGQEP